MSYHTGSGSRGMGGSSGRSNMPARTTAPQPSQPTQAQQPQTRRDFLATAAAVTATQRLNSNISYNVLDDAVQVDTRPRLNTCCTGECYSELIDCIRQVESGAEPNEGCNAPPTGCNSGLGCDCGPFQIDYKDYLRDICGGIDSRGVRIFAPCGDCPGITRDPAAGPGRGCYDRSCCEVCAPGYGASLCTPCPEGPGFAACCAEKARKSRKLIDCFQRRWTRNPDKKNGCECNGPRIHDYPDGDLNCCTCLEIARMHNGGPCGHTKSSTKKYEGKIKSCMERKGLSRCVNLVTTTSGGGVGTPADPYFTDIQGTNLQNAIRVNSYY